MARNMNRFFQMFHVPADPEAYYYVLREEMPDPLDGVIGYVLNDTCQDLKIAIEVDEDYMKVRDARLPLLYVDPEDYRKECRIVVTRLMVKRLQKKAPDILFGLWHQMGHFHNMEKYLQDYMTYEMNHEAGYTGEQYLAIINGEVLPYEAAADDFALQYCPAEYAVIAMNGIIAEEKSRTEGPVNRGKVQDCLNRKKRFLNRKEEADG